MNLLGVAGSRSFCCSCPNLLLTLNLELTYIDILRCIQNMTLRLLSYGLRVTLFSHVLLFTLAVLELGGGFSHIKSVDMIRFCSHAALLVAFFLFLCMLDSNLFTIMCLFLPCPALFPSIRGVRLPHWLWGGGPGERSVWSGALQPLWRTHRRGGDWWHGANWCLEGACLCIMWLVVGCVASCNGFRYKWPQVMSFREKPFYTF